MTQQVDLNAQVHGYYYGTQAAIEALTGVPLGSIGYATDRGANQHFGTYGASGWEWDTGTGSGDVPDRFWTSGTHGVNPVQAINPTTPRAIGNYAVAIGENGIASGTASFVWGGSNRLAGEYTHAGGDDNRVYGSYSYAFGVGSTVSGTASGAEAANGSDVVGNSSTIIGAVNSRLSGNRSVLLGGLNRSKVGSDTVFVPNLSIDTLPATLPISWLGITSDGYAVSGALNIQDEGVPKTSVLTLNFVGRNVDVSVSGTVARVMVTGSATYLSTLSPIIYTSSGTWTKPANLAYVIVEVVGGGGGGGGVAGDATAGFGASGNGGGGGEYALKKIMASSLGATEIVGIGAGGAGGTAGNNNGSSGTMSAFGSHVTALGGQGGNGQASSAAPVVGSSGGGLGGTGGLGGDLYIAGGSASWGMVTSGLVAPSKGGGTHLSADTKSGTAATSDEAGINATGHGAGGSGARVSASASNFAGGNGHAGVIVVWEYING